MKNDLHIHSNFSACANVENSWENILTKMQEKGLDRVAITDHNTCLFHVINKFKDSSKIFDGEILPGMECDVVEDGIAFELLAYNFDVIQMFNWAYEVYGTLEIRQTRMKDKLCKIAKESRLKVDDEMKFNGKVEYAHNFMFNNLRKSAENDWLFEEYNIQNSSDFYRLSTSLKSFPMYLNMGEMWPNAEQVVDAVHKAGGIVVLAHPFNYKPNVDIEKLLQLSLDKKIYGVEVYHPSCDNAKIEYLLNFAKKNNLIITGGSDYHGTDRHNELGIKNIDENQNNINI